MQELIMFHPDVYLPKTDFEREQYRKGYAEGKAKGYANWASDKCAGQSKCEGRHPLKLQTECTRVFQKSVRVCSSTLPIDWYVWIIPSGVKIPTC